MKLLALDSSGLVASVAVVEDDNMLAEYTVNYKKTHSQTLLPMLDEIVRMTEQDLGTVDAIAVAAGPGSFTGLRIGSATAKGLGLRWTSLSLLCLRWTRWPSIYMEAAPASAPSWTPEEVRCIPVCIPLRETNSGYFLPSGPRRCPIWWRS